MYCLVFSSTSSRRPRERDSAEVELLAGRLGDGQHASPTTSWSGEIGEVGIARGTSVDQREGEALCVCVCMCACVERVRP